MISCGKPSVYLRLSRLAHRTEMLAAEGARGGGARGVFLPHAHRESGFGDIGVGRSGLRLLGGVARVSALFLLQILTPRLTLTRFAELTHLRFQVFRQQGWPPLRGAAHRVEGGKGYGGGRGRRGAGPDVDR